MLKFCPFQFIYWRTQHTLWFDQKWSEKLSHVLWWGFEKLLGLWGTKFFNRLIHWWLAVQLGDGAFSECGPQWDALEGWIMTRAAPNSIYFVAAMEWAERIHYVISALVTAVWHSNPLECVIQTNLSSFQWRVLGIVYTTLPPVTFGDRTFHKNFWVAMPSVQSSGIKRTTTGSSNGVEEATLWI